MSGIGSTQEIEGTPALMRLEPFRALRLGRGEGELIREQILPPAELGDALRELR